MGLTTCEVRALDQAETSLCLIERSKPFLYMDFATLYDDLVLSAEDLEAERHPQNVEAFDFCLNRWITQVEACLKRYTEGNP